MQRPLLAGGRQVAAGASSSSSSGSGYRRFNSSAAMKMQSGSRSFAEATDYPVKTGYFVNGSERLGSGEKFESRNPATDEVVAQIYPCSNAEVDSVVEAAHEGFQIWSAMSGMERAAIMFRAAEILKTKAQEIAVVETMDSGHPIAETKPAHVDQGIATLEYYAGLAPTALEGRHLPLANGSYAISARVPYGVCAGIIAWNYPFNMALYKSSILLAAGNSVVLKPSSKTPVNTIGLAKVFTDAGMPPGVFNVVQGGGSVGSRLVEHPLVEKVSFTGSTKVGSMILQMCANTVKPATLELGGKSPLVIFDDADIDAAVKAALIANFYSSGEICTNGTRIFVQNSIMPEFLEKFRQAACNLKIGDPSDPSTQVGAMIDGGHADSVREAIQKGSHEGAELICGGPPFNANINLPPNCVPTNFVAPTIFSNVSDSMSIAKEEIFGPVACVLGFDDTEEAITRANATEYGLAAGVFTSDLKKAHYVTSKLDAGIVWCNTYNLYDPTVPVGGFKRSGFGREFGREALDFVTHTKSIYFEANPGDGLDF